MSGANVSSKKNRPVDFAKIFQIKADNKDDLSCISSNEFKLEFLGFPRDSSISIITDLLKQPCQMPCLNSFCTSIYNWLHSLTILHQIPIITLHLVGFHWRISPRIRAMLQRILLFIWYGRKWGPSLAKIFRPTCGYISFIIIICDKALEY